MPHSGTQDAHDLAFHIGIDPLFWIVIREGLTAKRLLDPVLFSPSGKWRILSNNCDENTF